MADFILNRKISVYTNPYPFPEGAFQIYGGGNFYNGFSIGESSNLSVVNKDGVLKFSRGASNANEETTVILGTIPKNEKKAIYIDIASPLSQPMTSAFKINNDNLPTNEAWTTAKIFHTKEGFPNSPYLQAGGVITIYFKHATALEAIPNLCEVRALWAL